MQLLFSLFSFPYLPSHFLFIFSRSQPLRSLSLSLVHFSPSLPCSGSLSIALFLLLFVVLSRRGAAVLSLSLARNCQKLDVRFRDGSVSFAPGGDFGMFCWFRLSFRPSHAAAAAGALQRNFLPFIAQHIFFGFFFFWFIFFSCVWFFSLLGGFGSFWWGFF